MSILHLSISFNGSIFGQSAEKKSSDTIKHVVHLTAVNTTLKQSVVDSISFEKGNKIEKSFDSLLQTIFDSNENDFLKLEKLIYEEHHLSSFLNDTISSDLKKSKDLIIESQDGIHLVLNRFAESYADTVKRNKLKPLIVEELRALYAKENQAIQSLQNISISKLEKEKRVSDIRNQLNILQLKLKPQIDSLNKVIVNSKEAAIFKIVYKKVNYRVLVVPSSTSSIKLHSNTKKNLQPLKTVWDSFKEKPLALLNAGMFEADGSAKGLLIINGKVIDTLDVSKKMSAGNFYLQPNGVFYIDTLGRYFVTKTDDYKKLIFSKQPKYVSYATQSGPMLLNNGKTNPNFTLNSVNKNIRNGVGIIDNLDNRVALFIISDSPCTFHDISSLFRAFSCSNALYFDGAISKMYTDIKGLKTGNVSEGQLGPVLSVSNKFKTNK